MIIIHYIVLWPSTRLTLDQAAFYDAKYFYEITKFEKVPLAIGAFEKELKIEDQGQYYSLFITVRNPGFHASQTLELDRLYQIAEQLSMLHAFCLASSDPETKQVLDENYSRIRQYKVQKFSTDFPVYADALVHQYSQYFKHANLFSQKLEMLLNRSKDSAYSMSLPEILSQPAVLCHGELSSEKIVFNQGKVTEITNWENVHYGSVAEDLSYLIISSASTEVRKKRFMSIFRRYFYKLVDCAVPKFRLSDLKEAFKRMHKYVVLTSIPELIRILESNDEDEKRRHADQWETALEDAIAIENGEYPSDNEDAFFAN